MGWLRADVRTRLPLLKKNELRYLLCSVVIVFVGTEEMMFRFLNVLPSV